MSAPVLLVIAGPTASGKTSMAIRLAQHFQTEIVSSDSRQFYRELTIGTAKPSAAELAAVRHHFIDSLSLNDDYNVSRYEQDALACLRELFQKHRLVILAGGSGLYMQAVCDGMDRLPSSDPDMRRQLTAELESKGIASLQSRLAALDPEYYSQVDLANPHRLLRAVEVCLLTGQKYSALRKGHRAVRDFTILKAGLNPDRETLLHAIDARVDAMMAAGLEEEARRLLPWRNHNALQTVGYKELFEYFDGKTGRDEAVARIKLHTRQYAKRQLTWFRRDAGIHWFRPDEAESLFALAHAAIQA